MITLFENYGNVYKLEVGRDGVKLFIARNPNALELFKVGIIGAIDLEWQLEWRESRRF